MVMYKSVKAAQKNKIRIGAHPSFPDLQGFGRREMKMEELECEKMVIYQIGALKTFLDIEGIPLSHISVRHDALGDPQLCTFTTSSLPILPAESSPFG